MADAIGRQLVNPLHERSLAALAPSMGVSRARLGQIEKAAFAKLRRLVRETDDFPLLREAFFGEEATP